MQLYCITVLHNTITFGGNNRRCIQFKHVLKTRWLGLAVKRFVTTPDYYCIIIQLCKCCICHLYHIIRNDSSGISFIALK